MSCRSLYIHIPFCERKCNYCAFESAVPQSGDFELWLAMLEGELSLRAAEVGRLKLSTCYFGGGTPTVLPAALWEALISLIERNFDFEAEAEVTVEANPNSLRADHLLAWRDWRVNRVSIGVQSFDDAELEQMGRLHSAREALCAISAALAAGFSVSGDFIFGLPRQSFKNWGRTLHEAVRCGLNHISLYQLSLEEGTPWAALPPETLADGYPPYRWAQWYLPRRGYAQYEVANFAKEWRESRHNINYWKEGEYLGLGPGAAGYLNGLRYKNFGSLKAYAESIYKKELPIAENERLPRERAAREAAVLGLRMTEGLDRVDFAERYGENEWASLLAALRKFPDELYTADEKGIRLTKKGMRVANLIWSEII
ncbi:MAG: radical SAM family heme chaperone HemW [Synergistaceae bacterium]|nr:radical SAM family heme chaperone HemW [Synergistaceae bacterium]